MGLKYHPPGDDCSTKIPAEAAFQLNIALSEPKSGRWTQLSKISQVVAVSLVVGCLGSDAFFESVPHLTLDGV